MIKELKIENYAIIDRLSIDFTPGLNTITGETGAGKSILLGALGLLAGNRADAAAFADNQSNCVIEGVFEIEQENELLTANDIPTEGGELIVRRTISPSGRSRAFINDEPVSLTLLKELSNHLVDIHSQHQTLLLSDTDYQTQIIDLISGYPTENYKTVYKKLKTSQRELKQLREQAASNRQRADFLDYQINQIVDAQINPEEIAEMEARVTILANATEIAEELTYASQAMNHDEMGVVINLKNSLNHINRLREKLPQAGEFSERLNSLYLESKDLASELESALDDIEMNPSELISLQERLDVVYHLLHKHSVDTPTELLGLMDGMQQELDSLTDVDDRITKLETEIEQLNEQAQTLSEQISNSRRQAAPMIESQVTETLAELGMKAARFVVEITDTPELTPTGRNTVTMLFSANAGKSPQSIEQVASGGEMSRVMLAIKGLISRSTKLTTIVFDEIDTGVSGAVAHKMGEIIVAMSQNMQVLNITHLPQVASKGESHFLVHKDGGRTHIHRLSYDERVDHIAAMLSGSEVTEAAKAQAKALLGK